MHTGFTDQSDPYTAHRTISLLTPQRIQAPQQDQVMEELEIETLSEPLMPIEDRSSDNETPIHQVQPLLGMTHSENLQLRNRN